MLTAACRVLFVSSARAASEMLNNLPPEIVEAIFANASAEDAMKSRRLSRRLKEIIDASRLARVRAEEITIASRLTSPRRLGRMRETANSPDTDKRRVVLRVRRKNTVEERTVERSHEIPMDDLDVDVPSCSATPLEDFPQLESCLQNVVSFGSRLVLSGVAVTLALLRSLTQRPQDLKRVKEITLNLCTIQGDEETKKELARFFSLTSMHSLSMEFCTCAEGLVDDELLSSMPLLESLIFKGRGLQEKMLGLTDRTLERWIESGRIPHRIELPHVEPSFSLRGIRRMIKSVDNPNSPGTVFLWNFGLVSTADENVVLSELLTSQNSAGLAISIVPHQNGSATLRASRPHRLCVVFNVDAPVEDLISGHVDSPVIVEAKPSNPLLALARISAK